MKKRQFYWIIVFAFLGSILVSSFVQAVNNSTKTETLATKNKKTEEKTEIIEAGEAGENIIGIYDKKAKTITFSGSGKLSWIPRQSYDDVTKIVIGEGITEIEFSAGSHFHGLQELIIPKSVQKIEDGIFDKSNYNLKKVYNYSSVEYDPRQYEWSGWKKDNEIRSFKANLEYVSPWKWMVDGKEVTKIPPNSKATAIPKNIILLII